MVCVLGTAQAQAQAQTLPPVPDLKLKFPIQPLSFSFSGAELGSYASGPLRTFRAESVWLQTAAFRLVTFSANERAYELNCRLTCQPIVMLSAGLEGRLSVPNLLPRTQSSHIFFRYSSLTTSEDVKRRGSYAVGFASSF